MEGKSIEELVKEREVRQFDEYRVDRMESIRKKERDIKYQLRGIEDEKVRLIDMNIDEYLDKYNNSYCEPGTPCTMTGTIGTISR